MSAAMRATRRFGWRGLVLLVTALVLTSCGWRGIANVPMPVGPGTGRDKMTVYVQMPDTLALNVNSRVRVADVYVGYLRRKLTAAGIPGTLIQTIRGLGYMLKHP